MTTSKNGHKVRIGKLSEFRPQAANANKHTERGLRMLDDAMSEDGYVAPMTAVADGEMVDGSARLERAFDRFDGEAIIVEHDGTKPIVTGRQEQRYAHGTQKPLECMARPIRNHSGDVYDPFVGSGTTLVAAENLNRKCYAIEISPAYVAVCLERMTTAFTHLKIERVDRAEAA